MREWPRGVRFGIKYKTSRTTFIAAHGLNGETDGRFMDAVFTATTHRIEGS
jgi:hypothetical protein